MSVLTEDECRATADRVKSRLWECETPQDVERVSDDERGAVKELAATEYGRPLAIQCANLKEYILREVQ